MDNTKLSSFEESDPLDQNLYSWLNFWKQLITYLLSIFATTPDFFTNPLNAILTSVVYAVGVIALGLAGIPLAILKRFPSIEYMLNAQVGHGKSIIFWPDPNFFNKVKPILDGALKALSTPAGPMKQTKEGPLVNNFNLDVAELLLFMSSAVYEVNSDAKSADESVKPITDLAKEWGLEFKHLSDLKKGAISGPFCGAFSRKGKNPFVVIVFKGTTPTDYGEFLTDATISRTEAEAHLFGQVHTGFYNRLFPDPSSLKPSSLPPYMSILNKTIEIIRELEKDGGKVQVWVAGHSLGAALASLFYARLIKSPQDLDSHDQGLDHQGPSQFDIRDCYTYGCPTIGDWRFASTFTSLINLPITRPQTLWRIINDADIVCRVPLGNDNLNILAQFGLDRLGNYAHIGEPIQIYTNGKPPTVFPHRYQTRIWITTWPVESEGPTIFVRRSGYNIIKGVYYFLYYWIPTLYTNDYQPKDTDNWVVWLSRAVVPKYFADHSPHRYLRSLELIQEEQKRQQKIKSGLRAGYTQ